MHDNAPCHAAKATIKCLEGLGFKDETLMVWPPNSPDINPIENLWAIIKQRVYADGKQFSTLHELWKAIKLESAAIPHSLVQKLTDSVNDRLFDVTNMIKLVEVCVFLKCEAYNKSFCSLPLSQTCFISL